MDDFKRKNIKHATSWDWNCPRVCKRRPRRYSKIT